VFYRCPAGLSCPGQLKEAITHYVSKDAADIEGFSDKTVEQLYEKGLIKGVADIYALKKEDLLALEGWKEKKTENILTAIEKSKHVSLERFVYALGIKNVGRHIASLLAEKFGSVEKLKDSGKEELTAIKEIGPETADSIIVFFSEKRNISEIEKLLRHGVKVTARAQTAKGRFSGKRVVFTGSLKTMSRSQAQKLVEEEGGEASSGVSSTTDFVVAGEDAGSKLEEAKKKGIKIISEEDFLKILK
jgi:DNA ligase (NAD+)